jgi:hypothetical protein
MTKKFMQEAQAELKCLRDESDAVKVVAWGRVGTGEAFDDSKVELAFPYCVPKHEGCTKDQLWSQYTGHCSACLILLYCVAAQSMLNVKLQRWW